METQLCRMLGIEFPLVAFSHCRDVVTAVSQSGGFGVLGAAGYTPDQLETELAWIDAHIDGKPYGVDLLIPENLAVRTEAGATWATSRDASRTSTAPSCATCCAGTMSIPPEAPTAGRTWTARRPTSSRPARS
jgi:hypothetical protein